jgi:hypothetical protein
MTPNGWEPELILVRWRAGVWKVIDQDLITDRYFLRWVQGSRPDAGVMHWVHRRDTQPIAEMEVIALMADDETIP